MNSITRMTLLTSCGYFLQVQFFLAFFLLRFTAGIVYQYLTIYRLSDYKSDFFLFDCKGLASK